MWEILEKFHGCRYLRSKSIALLGCYIGRKSDSLSNPLKMENALKSTLVCFHSILGTKAAMLIIQMRQGITFQILTFHEKNTDFPNLGPNFPDRDIEILL